MSEMAIPIPGAGPAVARRRRRTQGERSAETQARLLDATVECLYELGYTGTTTTEISRRAGVSRGAQLHHYPTKASLVTKAVEHLFHRRHDEFRAAMARLPEGSNVADAAIDLLWDALSGPTFYAWLELLVAARTDPELLASVSATSDRFGQTVAATFHELFPTAGDGTLETGFVFGLLEGMALHRIAHPDEDRATEILNLIKILARLVGHPDLASLVDTHSD